jgi:hypothetical protein
MRLAKFIASVLLLMAVLYIGLSSTTRVLACAGARQSTGFTCDCYFPNSNEYGIICGDDCLQTTNCDIPENKARIRVAK